MNLHMRQFDGLTFGMPVDASSPAFKRMKRNTFTRKMKPRGSCVEQTVRCVQASDVAAVMGEAGWLVRELQCMETIRWGSDNTEYYIIYEKAGEK